MSTQNLHRDVYSSLLHNCQNLEATKMPFSKWMDKYTVIQPGSVILISAKKKWTIQPWKAMKEP